MHEETIARARELARSTYASSEASERRPDARAPSARRPPAQARPVRRSHSQPQPSSQRPLERSTSSPARLVPSDYEVDGSPYRLDASSDEEELPVHPLPAAQQPQPQPQPQPQQHSRHRGAATPARGSPTEKLPESPLPSTPAQPPPSVSPMNALASASEDDSSPHAFRARRSRSMTTATLTPSMDAAVSSSGGGATAINAAAARRTRSLSLPRTPPRRARTRVDPLSPVTESPAAAGAAALRRARAAAAAAAATTAAVTASTAAEARWRVKRDERGSGGGGGRVVVEKQLLETVGGTVGKEEDLLGRLCADEAKKRYDTLSPRRGARAAQRDNIAELFVRERARFMSPPSADAAPAQRPRVRTLSGTPEPARKPALRVRRAVLGLLRGASRRSNAAAAAVEGLQDGRVPTPARSVFRL